MVLYLKLQLQFIHMFLFFSCSSLPPFSSSSTILSGINLHGTTLQLRIEEGKITNLHDSNSGLDYEGTWIIPAFIDSHVHLAYYPVSQELLNGGISAVIDLAAPVEFLSQNLQPLEIKRSGPMITSMQGYPTQSWGSNGYGIECADEQSVEDNIIELHNLGAEIIKLPLTSPPTLTDPQLNRAIQAAKNLGLPTVTHAMTNIQVARTGQAGVDILAHAPTEILNETSLSLWEDKTIISTLYAFGSTNSVSNLSQLYQRGAKILYGTDLGNTQDAGISTNELLLLAQTGMSNADIIDSGTSIPADFWGFSELGYIQEGYNASFLVLDADPYIDISTLGRPLEVWINGEKRE